MTKSNPAADRTSLTTDQLPDIVYLVDVEEQRNVFVNKSVQTVLLYTEEDIQRMGSDLFPTIIHPEDLPRVGAHYEALNELADGHSAIVEYRVQRKDGVYVWYRSTDTIYQRKPDGSPKLLLGSAYDISLLKEREETIALLNRELAHRVQNLFAVNLSMIRTARRKGGDLDEVLLDLEGRITALGAMQVRIRTDDLYLHDNLRDLVTSLFAELTKKQFVELEIADISMRPDYANPLAIILYELVCLSSMSGVKPQGAPLAVLKVRVESGELFLTWQDTLQQEPFADDSSAEGLKLMTYAAKMLGGTLTHRFENRRLDFLLQFPFSDRSQRTVH